MSDQYGKGSIIYKILIVILAAVLVASIYYPKKLWDQEAKNTQECRYRMTNLYNAELQFQRFHFAYTDSLEQLIDFVKTDSSYHALVDSMFAVELDTFRMKFDSLRQEQLQIEQFVEQVAPEDTVAVDSLGRWIESITIRNRLLRDELEALRERLTSHPCAPVPTFDTALEIIERKDFFLKYKIVFNMARQGETKKALEACSLVIADYERMMQNLEATKVKLNDIYTLVDSLHVCPTVRKPYILTVIDTSVIKYADVECPIDSIDIQKVESNFLLSTFGALELKNHGKIQGGEESWSTGPSK